MIILQPIGINIVIVPDQALDKEGDVYVPDQAQKEPLTGTIIAVGPGRADYQMSVKVGDRCAYPRFGWTETTMYDSEGQSARVIVVKESDCYFFMREEPDPEQARPPMQTQQGDGC